MQRLKLLFSLILLFGLTYAASDSAPYDFHTSFALFISVPSLKALADVAIAVVPGYTYLNKHIPIGIHLDWGSFLKLHVNSIFGVSVDLSKEKTILEVTNKRSKSLSIGIEGYTTTLQLFYNFSLFNGFIDLKGPLNITIKDAAFFLKATFDESKKGYMFTLSLGSGSLNCGVVDLVSVNGYWLLDYILRTYFFFVPPLGNALFKRALSYANDALSAILEDQDPEKTFIEILNNSSVLIKPQAALTLDSGKETIKLAKASVLVFPKDKKDPYYNNKPASMPVYLDNIGIQNQVFISESLLNSLIKAVMLSTPKEGILEYRRKDDSLERILMEFPELKRLIETDLYSIVYGFSSDTTLKVDKSNIYIEGKIRIRVEAEVYEEIQGNANNYAEINRTELITFYPDVRIKMNLTVSKYRMFLMIKEAVVLQCKKVESHEDINIKATEEEIRDSLQATLTEESSSMNGDFLIPLDLSEISPINFAAKYLREGALRFDKLDNFFVLGFNTRKSE